MLVVEHGEIPLMWFCLILSCSVGCFQSPAASRSARADFCGVASRWAAVVKFSQNFIFVSIWASCCTRQYLHVHIIPKHLKWNDCFMNSWSVRSILWLFGAVQSKWPCARRKNLVAIQVDWRNLVVIQVTFKTCASNLAPTHRVFLRKVTILHSTHLLFIVVCTCMYLYIMVYTTMYTDAHRAEPDLGRDPGLETRVCWA